MSKPSRVGHWCLLRCHLHACYEAPPAQGAWRTPDSDSKSTQPRPIQPRPLILVLSRLVGAGQPAGRPAGSSCGWSCSATSCSRRHFVGFAAVLLAVPMLPGRRVTVPHRRDAGAWSATALRCRRRLPSARRPCLVLDQRSVVARVPTPRRPTFRSRQRQPDHLLTCAIRTGAGHRCALRTGTTPIAAAPDGPVGNVGEGGGAPLRQPGQDWLRDDDHRSSSPSDPDRLKRGRCPPQRLHRRCQP